MRVVLVAFPRLFEPPKPLWGRLQQKQTESKGVCEIERAREDEDEGLATLHPR